MYVTECAIDLYRFLRKRGVTVRKQFDCLIASYAILNDVYLFHNDSGFEQISNHSKLKNYKYKS
jgi:predicted nucleic acid-binding protein